MRQIPRTSIISHFIESSHFVRMIVSRGSGRCEGAAALSAPCRSWRRQWRTSRRNYHELAARQAAGTPDAPCGLVAQPKLKKKDNQFNTFLTMSRFPTHLPLHKPHAVVQRAPELLQQVRRLHLRNLISYQYSVEWKEAGNSPSLSASLHCLAASRVQNAP